MKQFLLLLFFIFILSPCVLAAAFLVSGSGARPLSLGNAFVGQADDGSAIFINPAGLSEIAFPNFISMYSQPDTNLTYTSLGLAFPKIWGGTVGGGYRNRTVAKITISSQEVSHINQDITLMYAKELKPDLSISLDLRQISTGFSTVLPSLEGANGSGLTGDFGLKYQPTKWAGIGLALRNFFGTVKYLDNSTDSIPVSYLLGASLKLGGLDGYFKNLQQNVVWNLELSKAADEPQSMMHTGVEWQAAQSFALRFGLDQTPKSAGENYTHITAGFGLLFSGITFDYCYYKQGDPSGNVSHYLSLGYIGAEPTTKKKKKIKPEVIHFPDVPPGYWAKKEIETLASIGWLDKFPDGSFKPERPISRSETVLLLVKAKGWPDPTKKEPVFKDVPANFWAADFIQSAWENKLVLGYPDKTFRPRQTTTRAENAALLTRFDGIKLAEILKTPYQDVKTPHWAIKEVLAAKDNGLLNYLKGPAFKPNLGISRAELAVTLYQTQLAQEELKAAGLDTKQP